MTRRETRIDSHRAQYLIETYLQAKDGNRPHLMARAFAADATVNVASLRRTAAPPARLQGLEAITAALVSEVDQACENIYSFCLQRPDEPLKASAFTCDWLFVMTQRSSGDVRIGCGRYDWRFRFTDRWLVQRLDIVVAGIEVLPPSMWQAALAWVNTLGYPWSSSDEVLAYWPGEPRLDALKRFVAAGVSASSGTLG
ncbi:nuclear transport factor 2 family protein [Ideonella sp. BN130291]|uniref:nuclear transport factor 2 family protein n=1 Tax=Ideonella sp. BN130291 TaxID=3112940 RepID=UPI002E2726C4|nr:nuclear transport factor 2 family protein [Ideonella sp. BN130291]